MSNKSVYPSDEWQKQHMRERADYIRRWKRAYYAGNPVIRDDAFDLHWRNLLWLEDRYPHLADPKSPTQSVGYDDSTPLPPQA